MDPATLAALGGGLARAIRGGMKVAQTVSQAVNVTNQLNPSIAVVTGPGTASPATGGTASGSATPTAATTQQDTYPAGFFASPTGLGFTGPAVDDISEVPGFDLGGLFDNPLVLVGIVGVGAWLLLGGK